ncbi:tetratricopeptide repeat protein [Gloeothece verrucosa]|uniref:TPR repeat-containing protein n=1 Tax=Gloeothece verrucosa (strain PCC 7822) TaxID=497965 RepID=E0UDA2_GLOV7|nr:tetratricopeptide repeat protein [Gloeothece verrucosa]ADN14093.1 TPR repeat-containing protein [Gloeothece verrucosa PCC 7822]
MLHEDLQRGNYVAITGMGGVGKTELASQYIHRYGEAYEGITWFNDRQKGLAAEVLEYFSLQLNYEIPQQLRGKRLTLSEQVRECWGQYAASELPILLVFDDVTNLDNLREVVPSENRFRVLVTTRLQYLDPNFISEVGLEVLSPEYEPGKALELLQALLGKKDRRIYREPEAAADICRCLEYLPLGIILVGGYLVQDPDLSLEMMLGQLQERKLAEKSLQVRESLNQYQRGVRAAFALTWEELDPLSQQVGMFLSLFSPKLIIWDLVVWVALRKWHEEIANEEETEVNAELDSSGEVKKEDNYLSWSKYELNEGKKRLYQRNLLQRKEEREGSYKIHALVRWFLQEKLEESEEIKGVFRQTFAIAMISVAKIIPDSPTSKDIEDVKDFIPHIEALTESLIEEAKEKREEKRITLASVPDESLIWPFLGVGRFYQGQGLYSLAEPWYKPCLDVLKSHFGEEHPDVASSLNNLAALYSSMGRYSEAEPLYQQALEINERLLGTEHPDLASSLNNLAALYSSMGRYSEAEPLYQQALEINERLLGTEHPDLATSLNNLAALYSSMGRYSEAEPLYQQALEINERLLGTEHPDLATSLNNLAGLYSSMGRYSEAEPLYQQALEMRERLLGTEHPSVATSLNNLAGLYSSMGRYSEAEPLYQQALEINERLLGTEHPSVATSLNNLAGLYKAMGRYSEAEPLYQQALEMRERLLGTEHPDLASSLNNLAGLYKAMGRYSEAEPLYQQALEINERLLGTEHPDLATSLNNLAGLYDSMGRYSEAEPLYQQALEINERLLGTEHPDLATSLNNLAGLYDSMGRYSEAEPLYQQAWEMRERLLGTEHPDVASSLNNLAGLYSSMGRYSEAETLYQQALAILEPILGPNHPSTITVRENLVLLSQQRTRRYLWSRRLIKLVEFLLAIVCLPFYLLWLLFKQLFSFFFRRLR